MQLGFITSRLRVEEKLLMAALDRMNVPYVRFDDADFDLGLGADELSPRTQELRACDLVWNRSLSFGRAVYTTEILEALGIPSVNSSGIVATCGDKARTSMALERAGVPQPESVVAFTPEGALAAIERMGYPAVIKPVVGSWGRMVARVDDRGAAEALLETRAALGGWQSNVFYVQRYIDKPGRDLRVFVSGDRAIAAIARNSAHWVTNTARGATVEGLPISAELERLALAAARAVSAGARFCQLAIDIVESADGPLVLEVNHSCEFRNSSAPTGVDIPGVLASDVALLLARVSGHTPQRPAAVAATSAMVGGGV